MGALVPSSIINRAAKQLGSSMTVSNWLQENTVIASTARAFYNETLLEILRDFDWPFARVQQRLDLLICGYSLERRFAYKYPPGCVCIRRIFGPMGQNRNDDLQSAQRYIICEIPDPPLPLVPQNFGLNGSEFPPGGTYPQPPTFPIFPPGPRPTVKAILADHEYLNVEFTGDTTVVNDFPQDFQAAFMFKLAYYMAPSLTGGDPYHVGDRAKMMYEQCINTAAMHAYNEENQDPPRAGEFIDTRFRVGAGYTNGEGIPGGNGPYISGYSVQ